MADVSISTPAMVKQAGTLTSATNVNLGAAESGYRAFSDAVTSGEIASLDMVHVRVEKDSTNWAIWLATYTDAATDTLTLITTVASLGSIGTSGSVTVDVVLGQQIAQATATNAKHVFHGGNLIYTDHTTVQLEPGSCMVDGEWLEWTSNISSGVLGQASAGLSATGRWNWYLYNNSGTPALEFSQTVSTQSTDKTHWIKSGDSSRRWVGWHSVFDNAGTREIFLTWSCGGGGNLLSVGMEGDPTGAAPTRVVSDATPVATTLTAVGTAAGGTFNATDLVPESAFLLTLKGAYAGRVGSGGAWDGTIHMADNNTVSSLAYTQSVVRLNHDTTSPNNMFLPPSILRVKDPHTWYYAGAETTGTFTLIIDIMGASVHR